MIEDYVSVAGLTIQYCMSAPEVLQPVGKFIKLFSGLQLYSCVDIFEHIMGVFSHY